MAAPEVASIEEKIVVEQNDELNTWQYVEMKLADDNIRINYLSIYVVCLLLYAYV